jgi:hypothetical protein
MKSFLENNKVTLCANAETSAGTAVNGTAVDMAGYRNATFFATIATANAGNFIKVQGGATSGAATNDLEGTKVIADGNGDVVKVEVINPQYRFLRAVIVRAGTNTATGQIYAVQSNPRTGPQSNSDAEIHVSPGAGTA